MKYILLHYLKLFQQIFIVINQSVVKAPKDKNPHRKNKLKLCETEKFGRKVKN